MSIKETRKLEDEKVVVTTSYDNRSVLKDNLVARNAAQETGRYKKNTAGLVHVGRIHEGDVVRLMNMGYNLLTSDPEERKRALLYIQNNEPYLLTVPGKPIAKKKQVWT